MDKIITCMENYDRLNLAKSHEIYVDGFRLTKKEVKELSDFYERVAVRLIEEAIDDLETTEN